MGGGRTKIYKVDKLTSKAGLLDLNRRSIYDYKKRNETQEMIHTSMPERWSNHRGHIELQNNVNKITMVIVY